MNRPSPLGSALANGGREAGAGGRTRVDLVEPPAPTPAPADHGGQDDGLAAPANRILEAAENAVYVVAGLLLAVGAAAVLVTIGWHFIQEMDNGVEPAVITALDGLLLVFILLTLLAAVRATMLEHKLVAEPFLMAGMIVAIKEIIVVAVASKESREGGGEALRDAMAEVGVLATIVLVLAIAAYLVRRKEREPEEEKRS